MSTSSHLDATSLTAPRGHPFHSIKRPLVDAELYGHGGYTIAQPDGQPAEAACNPLGGHTMAKHIHEAAVGPPALGHWLLQHCPSKMERVRASVCHAAGDGRASE